MKKALLVILAMVLVLSVTLSMALTASGGTAPPNPPTLCTLTVNVLPPQGGTATGGGAWNRGTTVDIEAVPADESWHFVCWSGDLWSLENPTTIKMTCDKTITAHFVECDCDPGLPWWWWFWWWWWNWGL